MDSEGFSGVQNNRPDLSMVANSKCNLQIFLKNEVGDYNGNDLMTNSTLFVQKM